MNAHLSVVARATPQVLQGWVNLCVQVQASVLVRPMRVSSELSRRGFSEDSEVGQFPEPLECSALVGIGAGGPGVDPFGQSLLGSEPVEQREELLALGGLEAATELLLVLEGDLHDLAEQPPALLCEVQGPHATIAGSGPSHEQTALLEGVDQGHHPAGRDLQCVAQRLLGPAFIAGQAAEHHDLAGVKTKGRQPRLPPPRRVVAELGEQEGDPGDTQLLGWWGGGLAPGHDRNGSASESLLT